MKIVVGITGASGSIYAQELLRGLVQDERVAEIIVIFSDYGRQVWEHELGGGALEEFNEYTKLNIADNNSMFNSTASGSNPADAMVLVPCSMGTVGRIANGVSTTLLERTADVQLKEELPLVVVFRECPLSLIHLENLTQLKKAGATIMPASPSFYSHPTTIQELSKTIVERVLRKIKLKNADFFRWNKN